MKDITEQYYDYDGIIDTFEVKVIFSEYDNDYQGNAYYLLKEGRNRYGILIFGWGSCSGCDWLEAAYGDIEELTKLRDTLWGSITWVDSKADLRKYVSGKDFDLEHYRYSDGGPRFIQQLKDFVS